MSFIANYRRKKAEKFLNEHMYFSDVADLNTNIPFIGFDFKRKNNKKFLNLLSKKITIPFFYSIIYLFAVLAFSIFTPFGLVLKIIASLCMFIVYEIVILKSISKESDTGLKIRKEKNKIDKFIKIIQNTEGNSEDSELIQYVRLNGVNEKEIQELFSNKLTTALIAEFDNPYKYSCSENLSDGYNPNNPDRTYFLVQDFLQFVLKSVPKYTYKTEMNYRIALMKEEIRIKMANEIISKLQDLIGKNENMHNFILRMKKEDILNQYVYDNTFKPILIELDRVYKFHLVDLKNKSNQKNLEKERELSDARILIKSMTKIAEKI